MGLLRYQIFLTYGFAFLSIWAFLLNKSDKQYSLSDSSDVFVLLAPLWGLVALGIYLLLLLINGVLNYKDCPEASKELELETMEAKTEMKKRGII